MPNPLINKVAKTTGKSIGDVEKLWDKAKEAASKSYPQIPVESPRWYAAVVGIFKRMTGYKVASKVSESVHSGPLGILLKLREKCNRSSYES